MKYDHVVYLSVFLTGILGHILFSVTVDPVINYFLGGPYEILRNNYHIYIGVSLNVLCCLIPTLLMSKYAVYLTWREPDEMS